LKVRDINIRLIVDGRFWLDGGSMFGIVPKALWGRLVECDEKNRMPLALNCLLIETPDKRILFDAGIGTNTSPKFNKIYNVTDVRGMRYRIEEAGLRVEDIDMVVFSHLHFDHVDGAVEVVDGKPAPVFPNAEYIAQAGEWRHAHDTNEFTAGGYSDFSFDALERTGRLRLIEGDAEIAPGVRVHVTGGHTAHHQMLMIESGGEKAACFADLIPMTAHISLPYIMALDEYPMQTLEAKRRLLRRAADEDWLCFFDHECASPAGRIREHEGRFTFART
jgi:glyoxylase-like metal-dependent hydrolase (beta-lactamase superfamily II)